MTPEEMATAGQLIAGIKLALAKEDGTADVQLSLAALGEVAIEILAKSHEGCADPLCYRSHVTRWLEACIRAAKEREPTPAHAARGIRSIRRGHGLRRDPLKRRH